MSKEAYFSDYRFSEDLDYSSTGKVSEDKLKERLEKMLEFANTGPVEFIGLEFEPAMESGIWGKLLGV